MPRTTAKPKPAQTTAQQLGSLIKSARDIMRKDKGLNGDLDRLPQLTWIMFLKFLDDMEQMAEVEAQLNQAAFRPAIAAPYRWRDWATGGQGITGDDLLTFVGQDEAMRPDGQRGPGLLAYLRSLQSDDGRDRRDVIANVYRGVTNRMVNGYLLRDVINLVDSIHFTSSDEIHTLSHLYESMLRELRDAAGDSGEIYTPRPVVRFMVQMLDPRLGETMLDPALGTGGFAVEVFEHLKPQAVTVEQRRILQERSIYGQEAKALPYLLAQMNLLLHGLEFPAIAYGNSLAVKLSEIGDNERVDIILTNPPFGGEEEAGIKANFPDDKQTAETALLFLQLIMRKLRRGARGEGRGAGAPQSPNLSISQSPARAGVVVPNGTLFADGVAARIKEELLREFNLHTIVRLPNGVFAPYTSIPTNLIFFERGGPTREIWYYELPPPDGRKQYTKTRPIQSEEMADCLAWCKAWPRQENAQAWRVDFQALYADAQQRAQPHWAAAEAANAAAAAAEAALRTTETALRSLAADLRLLATPDGSARRQTLEEARTRLQADVSRQRQLARDEQAAGDAIYWPIYNLDRKNPNAAETLEHLPPEQLVAEIVAKERRILELMAEIEAELAGGVG